MLVFIAVLLLVASLAGGAYFASRAPAVTFSLFGAVVGAFIGYAANIADGRHGVPADVAAWATCALLVAGVVGLLAVRARASRRSLRRAAVAVLVALPFGAAVLAFLLLDACPLYVTDRAGYCYHEVDVLGGWISGVVALFVVDVMAIAVLLLLSTKRLEQP